MAKFKSYKGKQVVVGIKMITFSDREYETKVKEEIEALRNAKKVIEVQSQQGK